MKKIISKMEKAVAKTALAVTKMNVNTCCTLHVHQPKLPQGAEKLKKTN